MGYSTEFAGEIRIDPPLSEREIEYLKKFAETRRMDRGAGPYFVEGTGYAGQGHDADIRDFNRPPSCQPGLWCKWEPNDDGTAIAWNGVEKFYGAAEWMSYLRSHFLAGIPAAAVLDPEGMGWLPGGHELTGTIFAAGESGDDVWRLDVTAEGVFERRALDVELPDAEEDEDVWYEEYAARLEVAQQEDGYEWDAPTRIPDFNSQELEAVVRAKQEQAALDSKTGRGKKKERARRI